MKIKDVEQATNMTRTNIRFYEMEGFIDPIRHKNGYRDYSDEDVNTLKKIKFLRNLNISLEDIKFIHHHSIDFSDFLNKHINKLYLENDNINDSIDICEKMIQDKVNYEDLNIDEYLNHPIQTNSLEDIKTASKNIPWRRFLARLLDMNFYYLIYMVSVALYTSEYVYSIDRMSRPLSDFLYTLLIMFILEPILLSIFQTTLGKFILGLKVISTKDKKISYIEALRRTIYVFVDGMGCFFPFINLYCLYRSFITCESNHPCVWEDTNKTIILNQSKIRSIIYSFTFILFVYSCIVCNNMASFPLLRKGFITEGLSELEFSGNYNNYLKYKTDYLADGCMLFEDGIIYDKFRNPINDPRFPQLHYVENEEGELIEVSFSTEWTKKSPPHYLETIQLMILSLVKADESVFIPISRAEQIINEIIQKPYESFEFIEKDYTIKCEVEIDGYEKRCFNDTCVLTTDDPDPHYYFSFSITLNK